MSRYYVGFTQRGPTSLRNVRKAPTGELMMLVEEEEVKVLTLDFTGFLETGETVSSATLSSERVTASAEFSGTSVTLTISESEAYDLLGNITVLVNFSTGRTKRVVIRVRRKNVTAYEYDQAYD